VPWLRNPAIEAAREGFSATIRTQTMVAAGPPGKPGGVRRCQPMWRGAVRVATSCCRSCEIHARTCTTGTLLIGCWESLHHRARVTVDLTSRSTNT
jgi:hypothetical protein